MISPTAKSLRLGFLKRIKTPEGRAEFLKTATDADIQTAKSDWASLARVDQWPPDGHGWFTWLLLGGRGGGKSRSGAEVVKLAEENGYRMIGLVARTAADIRDVMVENPFSGLLSTYSDDDPRRPTYEPSKRRLTWPSGAMGTTYSAEEGKQLRGPQHDFIWADELCAWPIKPRMSDDNAWDHLRIGCRVKTGNLEPHIVVTTTPRPIDILLELIERKSTVLTHCTTYDNLQNLSASYRETVISQFEGTRLGDQELLAKILTEIEGALWTRGLINDLRIDPKIRPPIDKIVVGVDPGGSSKETADATGIVVVGRGANPIGYEDTGKPHGFVLADGTLHGSPHEWATETIRLFNQFDADEVIAEKNYGGEMVEHVLRSTPGGESLPIRLTHASKSKTLRAEPIAGIYEQRRFHHVGTFHELEDEMTTYVQGITIKSPNRLDALVHASLRLFPPRRRARGSIVSRRERSRSNAY